jgi:hypothetical protein
MSPSEINKSDSIMKSCNATLCRAGRKHFETAVCFEPCKSPNFDADAKTCTFPSMTHLFNAVVVNTRAKFVGLAPQCLRMRQMDQQCKVEYNASASYVQGVSKK